MDSELYKQKWGTETIEIVGESKKADCHATTKVFKSIPLDTLSFLWITPTRSLDTFPILQSDDDLFEIPSDNSSIQIVLVALSFSVHCELYQFYIFRSHRDIFDLHFQVWYTTIDSVVYTFVGWDQRFTLEGDALLSHSNCTGDWSCIMEQSNV